ncbi:MAG: BrnA antitoxin family protein [Acidobacteria bacterium]|nr:BrnA antitoxin family protein [Acidobacteriota bacterium]
MSNGSRQVASDLAALREQRDEHIDLSDIPELTDASRAIIGKFYRPIKKPVTVRLDADVLGWLKSKGVGYQTRINALLRHAMEKDAG